MRVQWSYLEDEMAKIVDFFVSLSFYFYAALLFTNLHDMNSSQFLAWS